jgi:leader peptidase (prepilin peptidase)/N-methyltransferase
MAAPAPPRQGFTRVLDFVTALWLGLVGACIGSFLNVVAYRTPRGMSVVWKPSHCPKCGHDIRARDNLPVLGWLLLRGRCRDCGAAISPRYAVVEAAMGAAFFTLAYVELFSGAANVPGGPFAEAASAWNTVWNPNWMVLRVYIYHCLLLSILMAMALIDQDRQRMPWRLVIIAFAVVAYASWSWRHLYFERTRTIRVPEIKAQFDALLGIIWGMSPWTLAMGVLYLRGKRAAIPPLRSMAMAAAVVGAFLGIRPVVRITVLWLVTWLATRALRPANEMRISPLVLLWFSTFFHIIFWKQLAAAFSW